MPILLLVRHAENNYLKLNRLPGRLPDVHLNRRGKAQARLLAERLKAAPIKAVYSSPLERAMETALPLAKALGLEVISRPGLIETDVGEWQGESIKKLGKQKYLARCATDSLLSPFPRRGELPGWPIAHLPGDFRFGRAARKGGYAGRGLPRRPDQAGSGLLPGHATGPLPAIERFPGGDNCFNAR